MAGQSDCMVKHEPNDIREGLTLESPGRGSSVREQRGVADGRDGLQHRELIHDDG